MSRRWIRYASIGVVFAPLSVAMFGVRHSARADEASTLPSVEAEDKFTIYSPADWQSKTVLIHLNIVQTGLSTGSGPVGLSQLPTVKGKLLLYRDDGVLLDVKSQLLYLPRASIFAMQLVVPKPKDPLPSVER